LDGLNVEDKFRVWIRIFGLHFTSLHFTSLRAFFAGHPERCQLDFVSGVLDLQPTNLKDSRQVSNTTKILSKLKETVSNAITIAAILQ